MTVLLRSFHLPLLSISGDIFRRSSLFHAKFLDGAYATAEEMMPIYSKKKEDMFPIRVQFSSLNCETPLRNDSLFFKKDTFVLFMEEKIQHKILEFCSELTNFITSLQVMNSIKAIFVAQALMIFFSPDVYAETCERNDNSYFSMPLLFIIALIGATVGGLVARQRKGELKRLNDQLRQINAALRRQAKIESYAPNLSYAPVGKTPESEVVVDPKKEELIIKLRTGKNYLRNHELEKAHTEFQAALVLAEALKDHVEAKKAARGLGASLQRQGKYKEAIKYHSKVLEIASKAGEDSGATEAYGAIADCYTELGDLEKAGKFYDKYISRLEKD